MEDLGDPIGDDGVTADSSVAWRAAGRVFTPPRLVDVLLAYAKIDQGFQGRILDPACGAGAILSAVGPKLGPKGQLHGIESDPRVAGDAARALGPWHHCLTLDVADALGRLEDLAERFDRVVANPPYVPWYRISAEVRTRLETSPYGGCPLFGRPRHRDAQPDLSLYFLILGVHALKPGGRLVYLLPPEWLTAPRAGPIRDWLLARVTVQWIVQFQGGGSLFGGTTSRPVSTRSMILVADRQPAPSGHQVRWLSVETTRATRDLVLAALAGWARDASEAGAPAGVASFDVPQSAWMGRGWSPRVRRTPLPRGTIPLGKLPRVHVLGGHQPRVAWLEWLELDDDAYRGLPESERVWLYPAVRRASEITFPVMVKTGRWWVFLPPELETFSQVEALAPALARLMAARVRACHADTALPGRWWAFPNPRNLNLTSSTLPRLLVPRTAGRLRASFDPHGHMIKGTNTMILVRHGSAYSIHALMGLLNSTIMQDVVADTCPDYHGVRVRLEPGVLRKIPVPNPYVGNRMMQVDRLEIAVQEALSGSGSWEVVDRLAKSIYE